MDPTTETDFEREIEIDNRGKVRINEKPTHQQRPPRTRERERKIDSRALRRVVGGYDTVTEISDFVDALWEALPKSARRGRGLTGKMEDLYRHYGEIDLVKAGKNVVYNYVEDRIIGGFQGRTSKSYREAQGRFGQNSPWDGSKLGGLTRHIGI